MRALSIGFVSFFSLIAPAALARTFSVANYSDQVDDNPGDGICHAASGSASSGYCTLRAAIMEANASPGVDTINLAGGNYVLTLSGTDNTAKTGDLDITEAVNIYGSTLSAVSISGSTLRDRILDIRGPHNVGLRDLTLKGGSSEAEGGCLYNNGGTLTVRNLTIQDCYGTEGGGLYSVGGSITVDAPYTIHFLRNGALIGGGMRLDGSTFRIDGGTAAGTSTFEDNIAWAGGAINAQRTISLTIPNARFLRNVATTSGGAIHYRTGTLSLSGGSFESNQAYRGGAIDAGGTLNVQATTFTSNYAEDVGGAVYVDTDDSATIRNATFDANTGGSGGAIFAYGFQNLVVAITGSTFRQNVAVESLGASIGFGAGGAISNYNANMTVSDSVFEANSATDSGGAMYCSYSQLTVVRSLFDGNTVSDGDAQYNTIRSSDSCTTSFTGVRF